MLDLTPEALPVVAPLFGALLSLPIDVIPHACSRFRSTVELTIGALVDHLVNLRSVNPC